MSAFEKLVEIRSQAVECLLNYLRWVEQQLEHSKRRRGSHEDGYRRQAAAKVTFARRQLEDRRIAIHEVPLVVYVDLRKLANLAWGFFKVPLSDLEQTITAVDSDARPDLRTHVDQWIPAAVVRIHRADWKWTANVAQRFWRSIHGGSGPRTTLYLDGWHGLNEEQRAELGRLLRSFADGCGNNVEVIGNIGDPPPPPAPDGWLPWMPAAVAVVTFAAVAALAWWLWPRIQYEFTFNEARDLEFWGEYIDGEAAATNHPDVAVTHECGSVSTDPGHCWLAFFPSNRNGPDAYAAVVTDQVGKLDKRRLIDAQVFVPIGARTCPNNCSTAKVFVWDAYGEMREGNYAELRSGRRWTISIDPRRANWPDPFLGFGVHFYYVDDSFLGPVYIDNVTIEWRPDWLLPTLIAILSLGLVASMGWRLWWTR